MAVNDLVWHAQLLSKEADFVLEELSQGLDKLSFIFFRRPPTYGGS